MKGARRDAGMSAKESEPKTWRYYDKSSLPTLLRHDTWDPVTAIALLCEIDPRNSELFKPEVYYKTSLVEPMMYDEAHPYWKIKLLSADKEANIPRCWYASVDDIQGAEADWEKKWREWPEITDPYTSFDEITAPQFAAERRFVEVGEIFDSSPDHRDDPTRSPKYFIDWALSKDIEIKWLEWAQARGYLAYPTRNPAASKSSSISKGTKPEKPEKAQEIAELRARANKIAIKLKRDGLPDKRITVKRVCEDLLKENFSSGKPIASRWGAIDGMRSYLKGEHHPKRNDEFRKAKSNRAKFNP